MTATLDSPLILSARKVTKRFGGLVAVHSVDFEIPEGSIVSLIGPNGAGKTTFFNIIAGIYDPTSGSVAIRGQKMIARPIRAWLEPFLWVTPGLVAAFVTLIALISMLLSAIARPDWYLRLLRRIGIFRSARPNDVVRAGIGRTFQ